MTGKRTQIALAGALLAGMSAPAMAETTTDLQSEVAQLRAELAQMRQQQDENWLTERRAQEIKGLVKDVLSDAETRASLLAEGATAGIDEKGKIFLQSADGSWKMNIGGQIQARYTWNLRDADEPETDDETESGFSVRRAKIFFSGHIADPKLKYKLQFDVNDSTNETNLDVATISYDLTDTLTVWVGEDKAPFLWEEMTSSKRQLAVERSYVNEMFTLDAVQGLGVVWEATEQLKIQGMLHDGSQSGDGTNSGGRFDDLSDSLGVILNDDDDFIGGPASGKDFDEDEVDYAFVVRADFLVMGDWKQTKDFTSWAGEDNMLRIGAALDYSVGDHDTEDPTAGSRTADILVWTVDAQFESNGFNLYGAFIASDIDFDGFEAAAVNGVKTFDEPEPMAFLVQGGYNFELGNGDHLEPFVRYEYIDYDVSEADKAVIGGQTYDEEVDLITFGINWYHKKHSAKFTADVVYALEPLPDGQDSLGLLSDSPSDDEQVAIRLQYQLLF